MQKIAAGAIVAVLLAFAFGAAGEVAAVEEAGKAEQVGYKPLPKGKVQVRIWETPRKYDRRSTDYGFSLLAWKDRAKWKHLKYGTTPDRIERDVVIEGVNFWLNLTWRPWGGTGGPMLYIRTTKAGRPGRHNLLNRGYITGGNAHVLDVGVRGTGNLGYIKVLKNTSEEVQIESATKGDATRTIYRVLAGKPWVECIPVKKYEFQRMHGETRIVIGADGVKAGSDWVCDAGRDYKKDVLAWFPRASKFNLTPCLDCDAIWAMMWEPRKKWRTKGMTLYKNPDVSQCMGSVYHGSLRAGWSEIGEGNPPFIVGDTYTLNDGGKFVMGVLPFYYWHYQRINQDLQKDKEFIINWKVAFTRLKRVSPESPFKTGGPWWPTYAGKWRIISRIGGKYYTSEITIDKAGVGKKRLAFKPPASGKLDYVLIYLYDRTKETPRNVYTPMDIYREAILGKKPAR